MSSSELWWLIFSVEQIQEERMMVRSIYNETGDRAGGAVQKGRWCSVQIYTLDEQLVVAVAVHAARASTIDGT